MREAATSPSLPFSARPHCDGFQVAAPSMDRLFGFTILLKGQSAVSDHLPTEDLLIVDLQHGIGRAEPLPPNTRAQESLLAPSPVRTGQDLSQPEPNEVIALSKDQEVGLPRTALRWIGIQRSQPVRRICSQVRFGQNGRLGATIQADPLAECVIERVVGSSGLVPSSRRHVPPGPHGEHSPTTQWPDQKGSEPEVSGRATR